MAVIAATVMIVAQTYAKVTHVFPVNQIIAVVPAQVSVAVVIAVHPENAKTVHPPGHARLNAVMKAAPSPIAAAGLKPARQLRLAVVSRREVIAVTMPTAVQVISARVMEFARKELMTNAKVWMGHVVERIFAAQVWFVTSNLDMKMVNVVLHPHRCTASTTIPIASATGWAAGNTW